MLLHPPARRELSHDGPVDLAACGAVDVLDARLSDLELGLAQCAPKMSVFAVHPLSVDEQSEALVHYRTARRCMKP